MTTTAAPAPTTVDGGRVTEVEHWTGAPLDSGWVATARHLVPRLAEEAADLDRRGEFAHAGFALAREHGLTTMLVPAEFGGGGASHAEACAVLAELAHGCPATSLALSMHTHVVAAQVWRHRRGLSAPALGRVVDDGLVLISTGASDWIDSDGTAERVDGGYVVRARKSPASGCPGGDVLVTSVRWDEAPEGPTVLHLSVPFTADGVRIEPTWDTLGMRATGSHTVVLDEVAVPDEAVTLARPVGEWHPVWATVLVAALPLIMSAYVGVAETAADRVLALVAGRPDLDERTSLAGRMLNRLTAARDSVRAMIDAAVGLTFEPTIEAASTALTRRTTAAESAIEVVDLALEVGGGAAYAIGPGIERLHRDVLGARYHPLPSFRQERFSGRLALGLDPLTGR